MSTESYADQVIAEAQRIACLGLDLGTASSAIQDAMTALAKQAEALKACNFSAHEVEAKCETCGHKRTFVIPEAKPAVLAGSMTHVSKMLDEIVRLVNFSKGQPDSRPDLGSGWLQGLTEEQFAQVKLWVSENGRK